MIAHLALTRTSTQAMQELLQLCRRDSVAGAQNVHTSAKWCGHPRASSAKKHKSAVQAQALAAAKPLAHTRAAALPVRVVRHKQHTATTGNTAARTSTRRGARSSHAKQSVRETS